MLKRFSTNNFFFQADDIDYRRAYLSNIFLLLFAVILGLLVPANYLSGYPMLALIDGAASLSALMLLWYFKKTHHLKLVSNAIVLLMFVIMALFIHQVGSAFHGLYWMILFPTMAIFLLGIKQGLIWCLLFYGYFLFVVQSHYSEWMLQHYRWESTVNIFVASLFLVIMLVFMERSRMEMHAALERKSQELALTDPLTGLANRRQFEQQMAESLARAQRNESRLALFFIDLDGFKQINDNFSHQVGDTVLEVLGARFGALVRKNETMCRFGGDEFCLIVPHFEERSELENIAQRLLQECTGEVLIDGHKIAIRMSVGIASYPENGEQAEQIVSAADSAMYRAKAKLNCGYEFADNSVQA